MSVVKIHTHTHPFGPLGTRVTGKINSRCSSPEGPHNRKYGDATAGCFGSAEEEISSLAPRESLSSVILRTFKNENHIICTLNSLLTQWQLSSGTNNVVDSTNKIDRTMNKIDRIMKKFARSTIRIVPEILLPTNYNTVL